MKIKLRTIWAGPRGVYQVGDVVDVSRKQARELIESHQASPVKNVARETATVADGPH